MDLIPSITWADRNTKYMIMGFNDFELYFSYETMVGARILGSGYFKIKNIWGPTTGKHMREMGLGDHAKEVSPEELKDIAEQAMIARFQAQLREKFLP